MSASPTPPPSTKVRSIMASVRSDNQWRLLGEHSYSSELGDNLEGENAGPRYCSQWTRFLVQDIKAGMTMFSR